MIELFKYLEEHTQCSYELTLNDHKRICATAKDYWQPHLQKREDVSDVDWSVNNNIYHFMWHDDNAFGRWVFFSNTLEGLLDKIKKHIEERTK